MSELSWHRFETHRSPKGHGMRAKHRNRTWEAWQDASGKWRLRVADRPQEIKTCQSWTAVRQHVAKIAKANPEANPARRRNESSEASYRRHKVELVDDESGDVVWTGPLGEFLDENDLEDLGWEQREFVAHLDRHGGITMGGGAAPMMTLRDANPRRSPKNPSKVDAHKALELRLFIDGSSELRASPRHLQEEIADLRQRMDVRTRLRLEKSKGVGLPDAEAEAIYGPMVERAYALFVRSGGSKMNKETRDYVARELAEDAHWEFKAERDAKQRGRANPKRTGKKWVRVPGEWLREGMIVKAPEWVVYFDPDTGHTDASGYYGVKLSWKEFYKVISKTPPKRLRVKLWDNDDGESLFVALNEDGSERKQGIDLNTADYPPVWLVDVDSIDMDAETRASTLRQGSYPPDYEGNPMKRKNVAKGKTGEVGEAEARELELYIDNDEPLYRKWQAIVKNLWRHRAKGRYQRERAVDGFMYLVDDGAKKYAKEFASPGEWNKIFDSATRRYLAGQYATSFENNERDEIEYAPPGAKQNNGRRRNPAPAKKKNPARGRKKNGAGLGAAIGSAVGAAVGMGVGSLALAGIGSVAGGAIGGHVGAPKDRKKRGAAGGAIGGALLGPIGAGVGGYIAGRKPDRKGNPSTAAIAEHREGNPSCGGGPVCHCGKKSRATALARRINI
jgi:hypothetical protein